MLKWTLATADESSVIALNCRKGLCMCRSGAAFDEPKGQPKMAMKREHDDSRRLTIEITQNGDEFWGTFFSSQTCFLPDELP